ncbi:MAG: YdeI/OmpD-associated family protein [Hyphomicrobium sp.]
MPTFRTRLESGGGNTLGFDVPEEIVLGFGKGKRVPVTVTINGHTYRNTVAVYGGKYMIGVAQEHRAPAGIAGPGPIEVTLELDTEKREVVVPPELQAALEADPLAKTVWDKLSFSHKRAHTEALAAAKAPETRARRVLKTIETLRGT